MTELPLSMTRRARALLLSLSGALPVSDARAGEADQRGVLQDGQVPDPGVGSARQDHSEGGEVCESTLALALARALS